MLAPRRPWTTGVVCWRSAYETCRRIIIRVVITEVSAEARKIRFEGIEQRKRLRRLYEVVVSSEADGVLVEVARHVVDQLKPRLPVKIRISPIHAEREGVRKLQVRLRGHGGEIKRPPGKLHAQFVHQLWMNHRSQRARNRLIAVKVVLKSRRQVKSIVQGGLIQQTPVVHEITHEQLLVGVKAVVDAHEAVVRIIAAENAA